MSYFVQLSWGYHLMNKKGETVSSKADEWNVAGRSHQ